MKFEDNKHMTLANVRKPAINFFQRWPTECHTFQRIHIGLGCKDGEANLEEYTRHYGKYC